MKRQGIILCITMTALIGGMFCTGCTGKDTEPAQTGRFRTGSGGGRESYHNGGDALTPDHTG